MDTGLKGRRAFVTGGSRGIGLTCCKALANEGVKIALCARGEEGLSKAKVELEETGTEVRAFVGDISTKGGTIAAFEEASRVLGGIDILVNNVGGSLGVTDLDSASIEDFEMVMDLNFWTALRLMKLAIPDMKSKGWGRIINIASIYGREYGGGGGYMAAKAAMIAASKHTAIALVKTGITVNSIAPGSIFFEGGTWDRFLSRSTEAEVESFIEKNLPMGKFGWLEPIGAACVFLASEQSGFITGVCMNVDGGQSRSII